MADKEKKRYFLEQHIIELSQRADLGNYPVFTDFLTTGEQTAACRLKHKIRENVKNIFFEMWGGHFDCNHVVLGFFPDSFMEYDRPPLFPISCILIEPANYRHAEKISHRDYLGAVLSLGISRAKIGDIRIEEQRAYLFCKEEIASFILEQLKKVRNTAVLCRIIEDIQQIPNQQYEVIQRTVASLRLDNVVAAMAGLARGRAAELIFQGKVVVDSSEQTSVSFICKNGCIISIRGYGKFRLQIPDVPLTKKGKNKIQIYKYI